MRAAEFLADLVGKLESHDLKYARAGAIAAMSYGEPRATLGVDVVIALDESELDTVASLFPPPEFYVSIDTPRAAVRSRTQFNVIHPTSGMKIDFFFVGDAIERSQIARRLRRPILPETEAWCSPPEELIIKEACLLRREWVRQAFARRRFDAADLSGADRSSETTKACGRPSARRPAGPCPGGCRGGLSRFQRTMRNAPGSWTTICGTPR